VALLSVTLTTSTCSVKGPSGDALVAAAYPMYVPLAATQFQYSTYWLVKREKAREGRKTMPAGRLRQSMA
jgi:hypothetical protein